VGIAYFYDGLEAETVNGAAGEAVRRSEQVLARKETLDLVRAYYKLGDKPRRRLLDLAKSLDDNDTA
jgi:hypothetical protein